MGSRHTLWLLLPESVRRCPADLAAVVGLTMLTICVVLLPGVRETSLRVIIGLPFILFLPGYAFIAALFPGTARAPARVVEHEYDDEFVSRIRYGGIDGIERVALSFGLSVAIVPLIGIGLSFTPFGLRLFPVLLGVSGFTVTATIVAAVRRWELPEDERFVVPYRTWLSRAKSGVVESEDRTTFALNVLLILSLLLAAGSVALAVAVPQQGEQFTEFYLLTEDDDGALVASNYPTDFVRGEGQPVIVGIENHERETVSYIVVLQLQRVEGAGTETQIVERSELDRFDATIRHGEELHRERLVDPDQIGDDLRLVFLLYIDDAPETPTRENAYRNLHLWVDVHETRDDVEPTE